MNADSADAFVEAIPMPTVLIRRDEKIEAANSAARDLLGEAVAGRHFIIALRQPSLLDAIEGTLRDGTPNATQYLTNDGQQDTTFRVTVRPVQTPSMGAVLVCFEDITHLEQAGQMRRDFVANVSHELKTPLTAVIGFIETLRGPARNDEAARDRFLGIMAAEASRMDRLVGDLLSLSRVEADERMRPTDQIDLGAILQSTIHGLSPVAQAADVSIGLNLPDAAVIASGDEDQLRQVFTNLIENAVKYGGAGADVTVSLTAPAFENRLRGNGVRVTVRDTGPGIASVHLPRLTERFYRVDAHRSREKGGTGLGLAIVKHIVNRHRGRLRFESTPGVGTEVTVLLPLE